MTNAAEVVQQWHDAVNARDIEAAVTLCDPEVGVGGPQGLGHGRDLMRAWLTRSGISLEPQEELVERDGRIVVHELAQWRTADAPAGAPSKIPEETWVVFEVVGDSISVVRRFETAADVPPPPT